MSMGAFALHLHPMNTQTTFRLPAALAQQLARLAKERGVPKSRLVREALERYFEEGEPLTAAQVRERTAPYIGAIRLDHRRLASDPIAHLIREHNWRP